MMHLLLIGVGWTAKCSQWRQESDEDGGTAGELDERSLNASIFFAHAATGVRRAMT